MKLVPKSLSLPLLTALLLLTSGLPIQAQYWQQEVRYEIEASLDDEADVIKAERFQLSYINRSPHSLHELYFHLYANAFLPESHYHELNKANYVPVRFGKNERDGLGTKVCNIRVNGQEVQYSINNTILRIPLTTPLRAGDSLQVSMQFETWFGDGGSMRRRMKMFRADGVKHYNAVHWYPVVCVYDRYGWHHNQHLDKECYANFGTFKVNLTLPDNYIVAATGLLQNRKEALPDSLRKRIDLSQYSTPSPVNPSDRISRGTKTWIFRAENVHNFAFTANPTYRLAEIQWGPTQIQVFVRQANAHQWQQTPALVNTLLSMYARQFGAYEYPNFVVADAQDGTEYGMMAIVTGTFPYHIPLIAHEVAHQWFYGMVANNEMAAAFLDEGFADYMTVWFLDRIFGEERAQSIGKKQIDRYLDAYSNRFARSYYGYLSAVHEGFDTPLATHASHFRGAIGQQGGYSMVYQKGAVMLHNLRYVLGDELFDKAIKHYVKQWKFKHPYPEDFRQSVTEATGLNLNWFFDDWLHSTKTIDYKIARISTLRKNQSYRLHFKRIGDMQMPLDFTVYTRSGQALQYHIPNEWFVKKTSAQVLPTWTGWGRKLRASYTVDINPQERISRVEIDPEGLLADVDRSNNRRFYRKLPPFQWDHQVRNIPYWPSWRHYARPDLWYNGYDGLQAGIHLNGNYFEKRYYYATTLWWNSGWPQNAQVSPENSALHRKWAFHASGGGYLWRALPQWQNHFQFRWNAGLYRHQIDLQRNFKTSDQFQPNFLSLAVSWRAQIRPQESDALYAIFPDLWQTGRLNTFLESTLSYQYKSTKAQGRQQLSIRNPAPGSAFAYSWVEALSIREYSLKKLRWRGRLFGRIGLGEAPPESALYAAGASPEEMYQNKYTRATGFFPPAITSANSINRLHAGGGLNVRAVAGSAYTTALTGRHGLSAGTELEFDRYFAFKIKKSAEWLSFNTYLFADAGLLSEPDFSTTTWVAGAGLGTSATLKLSRYRQIKPLVLRCDVPLLSYLNEWSVSPQWLLGIGRAF